MAFISEMSLDELFAHIQIRIKRDFLVGIDSRSTLTEQDDKTLRRLKSWRVQESRRNAETEARRAKLLDCLLQHGATSGLYRAMREVERSYRCPRPMLADLWSFVPRSIVKRWIENAKTRTKGNEAFGNLVCLAYECGDSEMLRRMLDYGVSFCTINESGIELFNLKNIRSNRSKVNLSMIRHSFEQAESGLVEEIYLPTEFLDSFLATVHARNAQGYTILQVALRNGHLHMFKHIASSIIHRMPANFALEPSEAMGYDELIAGCELRLSEVRMRLERLVDREDVFQQALSLFNAADELLALWRRYEAGMDEFFGEPLLAIVEETLEVFADDRVVRCREIWRKQAERRSAASFVAELARTAITEPTESFLKAARGSKLHQAADCGDFTGALECVRAGARLDLLDRHSGMTLLHRLIERGDEAMATLLLDAKADPRLGYYCRRSLLHLAVEQRSIAVVEAMLRNFTDPVARREYVEKASDGLTALQLAARSGQLRMCRCLMRYQAGYQQDKYASGELSPTALAADRDIRALFALTERLAMGANGGDAECLRSTLRNLPADELLAVCHARDRLGRDLADVARAAGHDNLAAEISGLVHETEGAAKSGGAHRSRADGIDDADALVPCRFERFLYRYINKKK